MLRRIYVKRPAATSEQRLTFLASKSISIAVSVCVPLFINNMATEKATGFHNDSSSDEEIRRQSVVESINLNKNLDAK